MRRILICFFIITMIIIGGNTLAFAHADTINLQINGQPVYPDAPAYIQDERTMVPLRFISEACAYTVDWNEDARAATVFGVHNILRLDIGSSIAIVNGEPVKLDVCAVIKENRTMVPLRFIIENMEAQVEWEQTTRTVNIFIDSQPLQPQPPIALSAADGRITGYYFDSASADMLFSYGNSFATVINFAYKVYADGSVEAKNYNSGWNEYALPFLTENGIEKLLLVTDFGDPPSKKQEGSAAMLTNIANRAIAVENIAHLVRQTGADGIDIDFEKMDTACRDSFSAFIRELKAALVDKTVSVSLKPCKSERETWLYMFDYRALGQAADRLHIMFYDEHYGGGDPGPVASPAWIRAGLDYMLTLIPKEKLHVMLGVYGRAWGGTYNGGSVHIARAREIIEEFNAELKWDEKSSTPYLLYEDKDGNPMQLWFEDAASLGQKAALVRQYGVAGIGVWRMGIVPDDLWQSIIENYKHEQI
ncbi:MAG: stalk domain-containing protein [Firmicutes bacterium]|nr:stalk domain-containing protein [Bacillota bacterium]